jgi:hypothetical protein
MKNLSFAEAKKEARYLSFLIIPFSSKHFLTVQTNAIATISEVSNDNSGITYIIIALSFFGVSISKPKAARRSYEPPKKRKWYA